MCSVSCQTTLRGAIKMSHPYDGVDKHRALLKTQLTAQHLKWKLCPMNLIVSLPKPPACDLKEQFPQDVDI